MPGTFIESKKAAAVSLLLFLPFLTVFAVNLFEIEPILGLLRAYLTDDGQQISTAGRFVVFGGLLLLPAALAVSISSMLTRPTIERGIRFRPSPVNMAVGGVVFASIGIVTGWMVVEAISCSRGICD